jgi:hypothetical protein
MTQMNREYVADGYPHARLIVAEGMGHELPGAAVFSRALTWMDPK